MGWENLGINTGKKSSSFPGKMILRVQKKSRVCFSKKMGEIFDKDLILEYVTVHIATLLGFYCHTV